MSWLFSVSYSWQLNGDFNPIHVSDWAARAFGFKKMIVPGYHFYLTEALEVPLVSYRKCL